MYKHRVIRRTTTDDYIFSGGSAFTPANGLVGYDFLYSYNFGSSSWDNTYPKLGTGRIAHGVTLINNEADLIIAGGKEYINGQPTLTSTVEKYNFAARTWTYINNIPGPNDYSFLVRNDGVLTAISSTANTVYEYDDTIDQWNQRTGVASAGVLFDASLVDTEELYQSCQ